VVQAPYLDVDLSGRHVDHAAGPDLDRVHPREFGVVAHQGDMLAELKTAEPSSGMATPPASSATLIPVLGRDGAVNVEIGAAVGRK
jgi:hypothetical protein